MSNWQNKIAVVTGAGSGIGAGLARYCAAQGMQVIACDISTEGLAELTKSAANHGANIHPQVLDVRVADDVEKLAEKVFDEYGHVSLLFNNAGVLVDGKSWERSTRDWQWIIDVNVMGVIHGIRSFVPRMLAQGQAGRVINTSSIGGLLGGGAYMAPYQGTKHMVTALSETLYQELQLEDAPITASVLCPGEVITGIWESDRLRPEEEHNVLASEAERQSHDQIAGSVAAGLTPDHFAQLAFQGIEADKFWLLPQPQFKPLLDKRHQSITEESNPLGMAELMGLFENE
ncbi:MAG: SDR family NAD(P)-dependent oxidoreductase [Pseudomonadales bacterium]